jgi:hypothetical protein
VGATVAIFKIKPDEGKPGVVCERPHAFLATAARQT